ncbi:hypothetical protein GCK32_005231 [Trichostrongylus colubriformis]|uniref:MAM domain-containing protein n=1 Tax=Trichostrongylus colubriformis TaxID=6319 RepID=A0AAN8FAU9_TRICO
MRTLIPLLILLAVGGHAEISSSADLNCDFSTICHWRNASGMEDNGEWVVSNRYEGDPQHLITTRREDDGYFAYTSGFMGRTTALLVSEVVSCQLGGGNIKYWYFKTGIESQLEVCIRQPPGSKDITAFKCYDGLSPNYIQQWIFRVIELPPMSQPFELIFRGTFYPPMDVIALTEIDYSSTLCDDHNHRIRQKRMTPHLIGFHDWQQIRNSDRYKGETMIVVAQTTANETSLESSHENSGLLEQLNVTNMATTAMPFSVTFSTQELSTTTTTTATTSTPSATTAISTELESFFTTTPTTGSTTDPMENFMRLLKQTVPVLPYIPILMRSLQPDATNPVGSNGVFGQVPSPDATSSVGSNGIFGQAPSPAGSQVFGVSQDTRRSPPVNASHFYNTDPVSPPEPQPEPSLIELAKKFGLLGEEDMLTTVPPLSFTLPPLAETTTDVSSMRNIFGMAMTTDRPDTLPTIYPPNLMSADTQKRTMSPSQANMAEPAGRKTETPRKLHNRIFRGKEKQRILTTSTTSTTEKPTEELVVFKKPTKMESEVATKLTELTKYLPKGATDELKLLREIPDIEGLTRGMDLSLVSKPGGFAKLKKQFVERLMRRTIGLPVEEANHSMPPPISPFRIMLGIFPRRPYINIQSCILRMNLEISNSGAEQSAGGSFASDDVTGSKLVGFSEGNDVEFVQFANDLKVTTPHGPPQRALNFAAPTASREDSTEQRSPRVGAAFTPSCPLVDCTFNDKTFCNYVTSVSDHNTSNGSLREWSIASNAVLNSLTGVPHDLSKTGSFIYAGGTTVSPEDTFILSTKLPVELKEAARLDFFVYQAGIKGRLQVCLNTVNNCALNIKGSTIDNKARRWKNYHVPLSTTTHAIHFVADELQDNYAIGLDHIQLLNKYGMAAQSCL